MFVDIEKKKCLIVGFVMQNSSVEDDSPVEYPEVPQYTEWHAYNGKLLLVRGRFEMQGVVFNEKTSIDTLSFVYMKKDSLVLSDSQGKTYTYHRVQLRVLPQALQYGLDGGAAAGHIAVLQPTCRVEGNVRQ